MEFSGIIVKWFSMVNFQPDCLGSNPLLLTVFGAMNKFFSFNFFTHKTGMILQTHNFLFVILKF